jgi:hypothetical protein
LKKLISPILLCGALAGFSMPATASLAQHLIGNFAASPIVAKKPFNVSCSRAYGEPKRINNTWGLGVFKGTAYGEVWYRANGKREVHVTSYNITKNVFVENAGNKANLNLWWINNKSKSQDNLKQTHLGDEARNPIQLSISAGNSNDRAVRLEFIFDKKGKDERCDAYVS